MISRLISRSSSHLRFLTLISSNPSLSSYSPAHTFVQSSSSSIPILQDPNFTITRYFSSNHDNNNGNSKDPSISASTWKLTDNNEGDSIFGDENASLSGIKDGNGDFYEGSGVNVGSWGGNAPETDIFGGIDKEFESKKSSSVSTGDDEWKTADGYKGWSFGDDEKDEIFDIGMTKQEQQSSERVDTVGEGETDKADNKQFEEEQKLLSDQLKGPNRAFGDLIAASGITDAMLDSLIALKDLEGVEGLPPLREIEDMRLERSERKSTNAEIERKKQEEVAKARVRQVDEKGRAYGTGRRKCSIARVWIQPGDGKFTINDKQFDVYFPVLDHRADLLRPFSETKTLGLWDVTSTVKGGGVSGQVGALRLGISRALQNWEPGLRPYLRSEGFLTRDSRVVERKKPGKAKARKSFQWVKR